MGDNMDTITEETIEVFMLSAIPPNKKNVIYREAFKLCEQLRISTNDIYDSYFLIEKINLDEEYQTWMNVPRMAVLCPLINFFIPDFLSNYLQQLTYSLQNTPDLKPQKELLLIITTTEPENAFTNQGKYHTTIYDLLLPIKIWADSAHIKFLAPSIIYNFKDNEDTLNNMKREIAAAKYKNRLYIGTAYENNRYIHKIMRE